MITLCCDKCWFWTLFNEWCIIKCTKRVTPTISTLECVSRSLGVLLQMTRESSMKPNNLRETKMSIHRPQTPPQDCLRWFNNIKLLETTRLQTTVLPYVGTASLDGHLHDLCSELHEGIYNSDHVFWSINNMLDRYLLGVTDSQTDDKLKEKHNKWYSYTEDRGSHCMVPWIWK